MSDIEQNALTAKRVGQYLIDAKVLTREQLDEALDRQRRMSQAGFHVLLGTILEEMGAIDRQSLEAIILRQRLDEGSVSLGSDADWAPFRSAPEPITNQPAQNGHSHPEAEAEAEAPVAAAEEASAVQSTESEAQPEPELQTAEPGMSEMTATDADESYAQGATEAMNIIPATFEAETPSEPDPQMASSSSTLVESTVGEPEQLTNAEASPTTDTDEVPVVAETESVEMEAETQVEESPLVDSTPAIGAEAPSPAEAAAPVEEPETAVAEPSVASTPQPSYLQDLSGQRVELGGFSFLRAQNGLDEHSVSAAVAQMLKHIRVLEDQLDEANQSLVHLDSMRRYGEQTIKAADTIADEIHSEAEKQAAAIRDRAQQEARRIVADAKARHDDVIRRAGERALHVADEIGKNIAEQRQINNRLVEMADRLIAGESTESTE